MLRIKELRSERGLSQAELAKALQVARSTFSMWELGAREPDYAMLCQIAEFFEVSTDYLLEQSDFRDDEEEGLAFANAYGPQLDALDGDIEAYYRFKDAEREDYLSSFAAPRATQNGLPIFEHDSIADPQERMLIDAYRAQPDMRPAVDKLLDLNVIKAEAPMLYARGVPCEPAHRVPVFLSEQSVSAGTGAYLGPEEMEMVSVDAVRLSEEVSFAVPVSGDSMEPRYSDGDVLLVQAGSVEVGEIGVFTIDGDAYVKKRGEGQLLSINEAYAPIPADESVRCNGKVVGVIRESDIIRD